MNAITQSDPPSPSDHLERKRAMISAELERSQAELTEIDGRVGALFAPAEQLVQSLQAQFASLQANTRSSLYAQAWKASAAASRKLVPLERGQRRAFWTVFWAGAIGYATSMNFGSTLTVLMSGGAVWFTYRHFYNKARKIFTAKATAPSNARLDAIKDCALSLMHFDKNPSDDPKFRYNCTQVFPGHADHLTVTWNIVAKHGEQFGATYVGFHENDASALAILLLRLPIDGFEAGFIEVRNGVLGQYADVKQGLLDLVNGESSKLSEAISQLHELASMRRSALKRVKLLSTKLESMDAQENAWRNVAIHRSALDEILMQVELFKVGMANAPKGLLLWGPPGTGKTSIARTMAGSTGCAFMAVTSADLKGEYQGQTAPKVRAVWNKAREQAPCIMFVDECEGVFGSRSGSSGVNFNAELVEAFLTEWDGVNSVAGQVFVVGATNLRENIDTAILSRFSAMVEIALPDMEARRRILEIEFSKAGISTPVTDTMAKETSGMSGRDLNTLSARFQGVALTEAPTEELFRKTIRDVRGKSATAVAQVSWDEVVLPERLKAKLQSLGKKISRAEEYRKMGLPTPKSLLLYGPPGTGKTQIARVLANESGVSFQAVTTADIKGSFQGESGRKVKDLFARARAQAPCLLFIDEIDIVTGARNSGGDTYSKEIVGQLLQEMDGIGSRDGTGQVFVIGATNCRDDMDQAVLSRFAEQEEVALPDTEARARILRVMLTTKPLGFELEAVLPRLAEATAGRSGRDLASMVNAAASQAMQRADIEGMEIEDIRILESDFDIPAEPVSA